MLACKSLGVYCDMKNVVITGSTRGIGKEIAKKMLLQGHNVIITSSNPSNVYETYREFQNDKNITGHCVPIVADISKFADCNNLLRQTLNVFEHVDIWINNAGVSVRDNLIDLNENNITKIINTNLLGTIFCCHIVIPQMILQKKGILINFEGAGSNGLNTPKYSVYGATKSAITQFTRSLSKEYAHTNIHFCTISPGMVITDLLLSNADLRSKQVFNIFGETTEYIANYLVSQIHKIKKNEHIRYLTVNRIIILLIISVFRKHRFFDEEGRFKK